MKQTAMRLGRVLSARGCGLFPLLLAVSIIAFALVCASPIDPVQQYILKLGTTVSPERRAALEEYWGVNDPPVERYVNWISNLLKGDWGESALYRRPVAEIIGERLPILWP